MTTLADISRKTNLGISTVSEVLRGKSGYTQATKDKVAAAAQALDYRPNRLSRGLRGARTHTIGILGGSIATPISQYKIKAVEQSARAAGYVCYISYLPWDDKKAVEASILELLSQRVDGLIVYSQAQSAHDTVSKLLGNSNCPVVYIDRAPQGAKYQVSINRRIGMEQAAQHLASLGHKYARFVTTNSDVYDPTLKTDIYRKAAEKAGLKLLSPWEYGIDPEKEIAHSAYDTVMKMIKAGDVAGAADCSHKASGAKPATALFMNNDEGALAALAALRDSDIGVPEQVSVIGFDDLTYSAFARPALTTIHQPREEVGQAAFEMLYKVMNDTNTSNSEHRKFDSKLIIRDSTGPVNGASKERKN